MAQKIKTHNKKDYTEKWQNSAQQVRFALDILHSYIFIVHICWSR